jgi:hypothetical protein
VEKQNEKSFVSSGATDVGYKQSFCGRNEGNSGKQKQAVNFGRQFQYEYSTVRHT